MADDNEKQAQKGRYESQIRSKRQQIQNQRAQKASYLSTAKRIGEVYDRLANDKATVKERKEDVGSFSRKDYDGFRGAQFDGTYKPEVEGLSSSYDSLVSLIDSNLDELNRARMKYENMAYDCDGAIGILEKGINSLYRSIQNLVN